MKWVLIVLGVLLLIPILALATLWIMCRQPDANRMRASVTIHQKPEAVWPYLYEADKLKKWVTWLIEVRQEPGPPVLGAQRVWVMEDRNNNNMRMEIQSRVEAVEQARRLTVALNTAGAFKGQATYLLTDLGNGQTRVDLDSRYDFDNGFARLMTPVVLKFARQKAEGDLARLRTAAETP